MPVQARGDAFRALAMAYRRFDKQTKVEVRKAINAATKPVKAEIANAAREVLPHRGGLGAWVAANRTVTQARLNGANPSVTVTTSKSNKAVAPRRAHRKAAASRGKGKKKFYDHSGGGYVFGKAADLRAINNGRVWHPYWGHAPKNRNGKIQLVPGRLGVGGSGFFDVAASRTEDRARNEILAALQRAANGMPPRIP